MTPSILTQNSLLIKHYRKIEVCRPQWIVEGVSHV